MPEMIFKISNELQEKLLTEYVDMVSEFTDIKKDKLLEIIKDNSIDYVFKHAEALDVLPEQKEKLKKLRCLNEFARLFPKKEDSLNMENPENKISQDKTFSLEKLKNRKASDFGMQR